MLPESRVDFAAGLLLLVGCYVFHRLSRFFLPEWLEWQMAKWAARRAVAARRNDPPCRLQINIGGAEGWIHAPARRAVG